MSICDSISRLKLNAIDLERIKKNGYDVGMLISHSRKIIYDAIEILEFHKKMMDDNDLHILEYSDKWQAYNNWCTSQAINPEIRCGDGNHYADIFAYEHKYKPGDVLDVIRTPDGCLLNLVKIDPEELEPYLIFIVTSVKTNSISGFFKAL